MEFAYPELLEFALASFLIELTPGPNMTYLALVSARSGRRAGFTAVAGVALGLALVGLVASLGLAEAIAASPKLYAILKWGGVAYLCYLAWEAWRDGDRVIGETLAHDENFFAKGLITNLLNPKVAIFYVTVMPPFLDTRFPVGAQLAVLSAVYVLVATGIHLTIVTAAGFLRPVMANERYIMFSGRFFAIALFGVAIWVARSTG